MDNNFDIAALGKILKKSEIVSFAYLFGSRATGYANQNSDFDIAIYPEDLYIKCEDQLKKLSLLNNLQAEIEKALGSSKIDLIDLSIATPLLKYKIIKSGLLISEKDLSFRARKVSRWVMEYLDIQPFLFSRNKTALSKLNGDIDVT